MASFFAGNSGGVTLNGNARIIRYANGDESLVFGSEAIGPLGDHYEPEEVVEDIQMIGRNNLVNTGDGCEYIRL